MVLIMKIIRAKEYVVVRLDEGDEVIASLSDATRSENLGSGVVVSFVGALKSARLILRKGLEKTISTHLEAVGNGNISWFNNAPFVHIHVSVGSDQGVWVGHLLEGITDVFCEVIISPIEVRMTRSYSKELADSGVTVPFRLDIG